jgi:hypothetical protein
LFWQLGCALSARIAAKQPVLAEKTFRDVHDYLFSKHALIPNVRNSCEWQARLVAIQNDMVKSNSQHSHPLKVALKTFSYAPQRWDSESTPERRFCILIVAIALLLAIQSQDMRQPEHFRSKCRVALVMLGPEFVVACGLSNDYATEFIRFLRRFDVADHDPAVSLRHMREFLRRPGLCENCVVGGSLWWSLHL